MTTYVAKYVCTNSYVSVIFLTSSYKKMDSATVFLRHIESRKIIKLNIWEADMQDMTQTKIVCKIHCDEVMYSLNVHSYCMLNGISKFKN